jgi:hypothetical protein
MQDSLDLLGLIDVSENLVSEILNEIKNDSNPEDIAKLSKDIYLCRSVIEATYEKKYGRELQWKKEGSNQGDED